MLMNAYKDKISKIPDESFHSLINQVRKIIQTAEDVKSDYHIRIIKDTKSTLQFEIYFGKELLATKGLLVGDLSFLKMMLRKIKINPGRPSKRDTLSLQQASSGKRVQVSVGEDQPE